MKKELVTADDFIEFVESVPKEKWCRVHTYMGSPLEPRQCCMLGQINFKIDGNAATSSTFSKKELVRKIQENLLKLIKGKRFLDIAFINDLAESDDKVKEFWLNTLNNIKNAKGTDKN